MDDNQRKIPTPEEIVAKNELQLANYQRFPEYQKYAMEHQWRIDNGFLPFESHVLTLDEWREHPIKLGGLKDQTAIHLNENKKKLAKKKMLEAEDKAKERG